MPTKISASRLEVGIFLLLCLFWGTTWLAIKLSLATIPPVFGVAIRFAVSAALLLLLARLIHAAGMLRAGGPALRALARVIQHSTFVVAAGLILARLV